MSQLQGLQPSRPKPQWWGAQASQRWPKTLPRLCQLFNCLGCLTSRGKLSMACLQCRDDSDRHRFSGHTRCSSCQWGRNCRGRTRRRCVCSSSLACTRCTSGQPRSPGTNTSRPLGGSSLLSSPARDTGKAGILIHLWHFHSSPQYIHDTPSPLYVQCTSGTPQCCDHNCLVC